MSTTPRRATLAKDSSGAVARPLAPAALAGALGIVYGDIGTSPLYAFRECLSAAGGGPQAADVLGILSLVVWSLIVVVSLKYVAVVMRADNGGEGGIVALMALALSAVDGRRGRRAILAVGILGAAMFLGDGAITPAISVLSAVEGLSVATPAFQPYVVPLALGILLALFAIQFRGSGGIGRFFGPVMGLWFVVLGGVGLVHIVQHPGVLAALDPRHALALVAHGPPLSVLGVLGSVFLALTGAEALYADMGQFGPRPVRVDWFALVLPALVLNYFGQGSLVLANPKAADAPFYALFPDWALYPVVALATAATAIASQAVIAGAFTLVQQAGRLGLLPRLHARQTSAHAIGQVYLPQINLVLALAVAILVVTFRSSQALSAAYGIAVVTTMLATTILAIVVARRLWRWPLPAIGLVFGLFGTADIAFVGANLLKIPQGGWFPVGIGVALCLVMAAWRRGRAAMLAALSADELPFDAFLRDLEARRVPRVEGTAIYLTGSRAHTSPALTLNLRHNRVLHARVILLNVEILHRPFLPSGTPRAHTRPMPQGFVFATLRFGFMERPDILAAVAEDPEALLVDPETTSFFVDREMPVPPAGSGLHAWEATLYTVLARHAVRAPDYFKVPAKHTVELGTQVEL